MRNTHVIYTALLLSTIVFPQSVFAINEVQFTATTPLELQTIDTSVATTISVGNGGQASIVDVQPSWIDITLDAGSNATLTAQTGLFLKIEQPSGSTNFTQTPTCPTNSATLTGTGASAVLRIKVYSTNQCTISSGGGGGSGTSSKGGNSGGGSNSGSNSTPTQITTTPPIQNQIPTAPSQTNQTIVAQSLIKLADDQNAKTQDDTTVYFVGEDLKRHAFINPLVFHTWYCDFLDVKVISKETMASLPLGANVPYRPGFRMVKFPSVAQVYAVDYGSILRPIASESIAESLYGKNWNTFIDDISEAFYTDYTIGNPITSLQDLQPLIQNTAQDISPHTFACEKTPQNKPPLSEIPGFPPMFRFAKALYPNDIDPVSIKNLQIFLKALGPTIYPEARVTGIYGSLTQAAIQRFQQRFNIEQTGNVGGLTRTKINEMLDSIFKNK